MKARSGLLPPRDSDTRPRPARAAAAPTLHVDLRRRGRDRTRNVLQHEPFDRHPVRRRPLGAVVGLVDEDAVVRDAGERDALVGDARDAPRGVRDGLDPDAVLGGFDRGVFEEDGFDRVVGAATYGADREAVTAGADASRECDALSWC